jgi:hypothetical protein
VREQQAKSGFYRPENASRPKLECYQTRDGWTWCQTSRSSSRAEQHRVVTGAWRRQTQLPSVGKQIPLGRR